MKLPFNTKLMSHPANWVTVTAMAMIGALALDYLIRSTGSLSNG